MENANFRKQDNGHTASFALAYLRAEFDEERLDVAPLNVATRRAGKEQLKSSLMLTLQALMVPVSGTGLEGVSRWTMLAPVAIGAVFRS